MESLILGTIVFIALLIGYLYQEYGYKYKNRNMYNSPDHWHLYYYDSGITPKTKIKNKILKYIKKY